MKKLANIFFEYCEHNSKEEYGKKLNSMGYKFPTHKNPGYKYIDVHGNKATVDPKRPYGLVTYEPFLSEKYYPTPEEAVLHIKRADEWQVINMITGEVVYWPGGL